MPGSESMLAGVEAIPGFALPVPDASRYLDMKADVRWNLNRVPLR